MRELDEVLQAFLVQSFEALSEHDKRLFESVLDLPDPELYGYLVGRSEPNDPNVAHLVTRIRRSVSPEA